MRPKYVSWIAMIILGAACQVNTPESSSAGDTPAPSSSQTAQLAETMYYSWSGTGKAGFDVVANEMPQIYKDGYVVAPNNAFYDEGLGNTGELASTAGECYEIAGPDGKVTVMVVDANPDSPPNDAFLFDLSDTAFAKIAPLSTGVVPVAFRWVPTPTTGNVKLYVDSGSSNYYLSVLVYNYAIGIKKLELSSTGTGGKWVTLVRNETNRFIWNPSPSSVGTQVRFRVTSRQGQVIQFDPIDTITPGQSYEAAAQFTNLEALEPPPVWPGPPRTIYDDALGTEAGVGWEQWSVFNLTPSTPSYTDTTQPHTGDYCILAGSFGGYGLIQVAYPIAFDRSSYTGLELWVRSDTATASSSLQVTISDGASTTSTAYSLTGVSSTWRRFRVNFEDVSAPAKMEYFTVANSSSTAGPTIWLDDIRLY